MRREDLALQITLKTLEVSPGVFIPAKEYCKKVIEFYNEVFNGLPAQIQPLVKK